MSFERGLLFENAAEINEADLSDPAQVYDAAQALLFRNIGPVNDPILERLREDRQTWPHDQRLRFFENLPVDLTLELIERQMVMDRMALPRFSPLPPQSPTLLAPPPSVLGRSSGSDCAGSVVSDYWVRPPTPPDSE